MSVATLTALHLYGRFGTEFVDIYRLWRVNPAVPVEETAGAIADMVNFRLRWKTSGLAADMIRRRPAQGKRGLDSPRSGENALGATLGAARAMEKGDASVAPRDSLLQKLPRGGMRTSRRGSWAE